MNYPTNCRWCESGSLTTKAHSAKARWIVEDSKSSEVTKLVECVSCGVLYFDSCYSVIEIERMYVGYRDMSYFKRRHRYEPWYSKKINASIGHSPEVLKMRRHHLENLLTNLEGSQDKNVVIARVLDVGGDEGQFIPNLESITDRAVLEISGVQIASGTRLFNSWQEAEGYNPDLVMICHVLEHIENPRDYLVEAAKICRQGSYLYIEVPLDGPKNIPTFFATTSYLKYTTFLCRHPLLFIFADLLSQVSRRFLGRPIVGSILKQSEHINYFSTESFSKVTETTGFKEIKRSVYSVSNGVPILDVNALGVLLRRN